uniref:Uncharacterized protein n=1 Tax=Oryza punctata TaxID=4537 RepID=A0A0E0JXW7_ORYPU
MAAWVLETGACDLVPLCMPGARRNPQNDKKERISKNKEEVLSKAENDLAVVVNCQQHWKVSKELPGPTSGSSEGPLPSVLVSMVFLYICSRYRNMLKLQHSVDFARLVLYCPAEINDYLLELGDKSVEPLQINVLDYLLGVADLSGENQIYTRLYTVMASIWKYLAQLD